MGLIKQRAEMLNRPNESTADRFIVALELGASGVKLIKAKKVAAGLEIVRADQVRIPELEDGQNEEKVLKDSIHELLRNEDVSEQTILVSINNPHTCFGRFVIPKIPQKEINEILKWKMQELISFDLQDAVLDYRLVEIPGTAKEPRFIALTTATPRDVINKYFKILMEAGVPNFTPAYTVFSIDSMSSLCPTIQSGLVAVLDLGYSMSELAFYENGKLSFLRKLGFGSKTLTGLLMQSLAGERGRVALNRDEASEVLNKENLFHSQGADLIAGKIERSKLFALIRPELEKLAAEIERSIDFFSQEHSKSVHSLILGGGFSRMEGLDSFLKEALDLPVLAIEPTNRGGVTTSLTARNWAPFFRLLNCILDRPELFESEHALFDGRAHKIIKKLSYPKVALVCGILFAVLTGGLFVREVQLRSLIQNTQLQIQNLKPGFEFSQKIRVLETQIQNSENLIKLLSNDHLNWKEIFSELAYVTPREVILTSVSYQEGALVIKGIIRGENSQTILSNIIVSAQGPVFKRVSLVSVEQKPELKQSFFTLRCEL